MLALSTMKAVDGSLKEETLVCVSDADGGLQHWLLAAAAEQSKHRDHHCLHSRSSTCNHAMNYVTLLKWCACLHAYCKPLIH